MTLKVIFVTKKKKKLTFSNYSIFRHFVKQIILVASNTEIANNCQLSGVGL